jgi:GH24 family phage-related lysozyme (muramidase)
MALKDLLWNTIMSLITNARRINEQASRSTTEEARVWSSYGGSSSDLVKRRYQEEWKCLVKIR